MLGVGAAWRRMGLGRSGIGACGRSVNQSALAAPYYGYGYGYPAYGYGYGYPAYGYGYGTGYGYGYGTGYGYAPTYGYGYGTGYGYSAYGSGYGTGYSYPGYSYAYHPVVQSTNLCHHCWRPASLALLSLAKPRAPLAEPSH